MMLTKFRIKYYLYNNLAFIIIQPCSIFGNPTWRRLERKIKIRRQPLVTWERSRDFNVCHVKSSLQPVPGSLAWFAAILVCVSQRPWGRGWLSSSLIYSKKELIWPPTWQQLWPYYLCFYKKKKNKWAGICSSRNKATVIIRWLY